MSNKPLKKNVKKVKNKHNNLSKFSKSQLTKIKSLVKEEMNVNRKDAHKHLSRNLKNLGQCVVSPFSNGATGALMPSSNLRSLLPCKDILTLEISPDLFFNATGAADFQPVTLSGWIVSLQPRCLSTGVTEMYYSADAVANQYDPYTFKYRWSVVDGDIQASTTALPLANMYYICLAAVGTTQDAKGKIDSGIYSITNVESPTMNEEKVDLSDIDFTARSKFALNLKDGSTQTMLGQDACDVIGFSRAKAMEDNGETGRIIAMGLKCWTEEAQINASGSVTGGLISVNSWWNMCMQCEFWAQSGCPQMPDPLTFSDSFLHRRVFTGLDGVTIRYNPFQSQEQRRMNSVVTYATREIIDDQANKFNSFDNYQERDVTSGTMYDSNQDLCSAGDLVPVFQWFYSGDLSKTDDLYTLKVQAVVHSQITPKQTCPFQSRTLDPIPDHEMNRFILVQSDLEKYPYVVDGHCFGDFLKRVGKFVKGAAETIAKPLLAGAKIAKFISAL